MYKCKCKNGWYPTKPGSLVEMQCYICNGKGEVDEETAIAYSILSKYPKKKCPKCKGSKQEKYLINPMDEGEKDFQPVYGFKECSRCKGKGKI